ncbi:acetylornithine deacetylase [Marinobacter sp. F4216]|uniref:acetylornithine deacetylase n=1 Tax=Marinobacter sp. F4216 TaxID=2874281 RepID=UPI001CBCDF34|nr:acetylornithine deacetylase [Marinobacter sp. F4216]MBZ2169225.1 acetylornithine deacetylase [Marinobacter sp. F4216]
MLRLLKWLVVLGLVGVAAFKAGVWWLADQRAADARTALEPLGVFERGTIRSGLEGQLVLSNASWQDFRLTSPLAIGRFEFDAGSPLDLIEALMDPASLSGGWTLQAEGLEMSLNSPMLRNWVTDETVAQASLPPLFVLSCSADPNQPISSQDLMNIGIPGLTGGELLMHQRPDGLLIELNTAGTGSIEIDWPGARFQPHDPEAVLDSSSQLITVTLRDSGLMRRISAYCSERAGIEPADWARRTVQVLEGALKARGLLPSDQFEALYRQWLLEGGEVTAVLRPDGEFAGVPVYPAGVAGPGWDVTYNSAVVPDVYLQKTQAPAAPVSRAAVPVVESGESAREKRWYAQSLETADRWIGHTVRVTLSNDNVVEGRLVKVGERELEVARKVGGGEVAYPMLIRAVTGFEVWRRGQTQ